MSGADELQARGPRRLSLPFAAESVRVARRELEDWINDSVDRDEIVADCRLVLSELIGNAVRHARPLADGTVDVGWGCTDHEIAFSVTDGGSPSHPHVIDAEPDALGGRGLTIVEALSRRWWIERTALQTTVHAVLALA